MTAMPAPVPTADKDLVMRLPPYFPTSCKPCAEVTQTFFTCFEQHAFMKDDTDKLTAAHSLENCQPELKAYMRCMEEHIHKQSKPWWKFL